MKLAWRFTSMLPNGWQSPLGCQMSCLSKYICTSIIDMGIFLCVCYKVFFIEDAFLPNFAFLRICILSRKCFIFKWYFPWHCHFKQTAYLKTTLVYNWLKSGSKILAGIAISSSLKMYWEFQRPVSSFLQQKRTTISILKG